MNAEQLDEKVSAYCMKASSSLLAALIGGPASFSFVFAGIARYMPAKVVPRVAIASWME